MIVKHQHTTKTRQRDSRGFTLMEMIMVILIITLLIGMGVYSMRDVVGDAETVTAKAGVSTLETNLIRYRTVTGGYPSSAQGLQAMVSKPSTNPIPKKWKSLLKANALTDPWQNPYQYKNPGVRNQGSYDVFSFGADGVESEDDIGNWE